MTTQDQNTLSYAAGWYTDTANPGNERYYDGAAWTQQTRAVTATPTPPADAPKKKRKWPWVLIAAAVVFLVIVITAMNSGGTEEASVADKPAAVAEEVEAPAEEVAPAEPAEPAAPVMTLAQENAMSEAQNYVRIMPFSRQGLIDQLIFGGYTAEDATFGADSAGADWSAECAEAAQNYLNTMAFSREALYEQLAFENYTPEQIEFALVSVGY